MNLTTIYQNPTERNKVARYTLSHGTMSDWLSIQHDPEISQPLSVVNVLRAKSNNIEAKITQLEEMIALATEDDIEALLTAELETAQNTAQRIWDELEDAEQCLYHALDTHPIGRFISDKLWQFRAWYIQEK